MHHTPAVTDVDAPAYLTSLFAIDLFRDHRWASPFRLRPQHNLKDVRLLDILGPLVEAWCVSRTRISIWLRGDHARSDHQLNRTALY
jgi:hypothetical protein